MKATGFTSLWAVTADQRSSRRATDRVPEALRTLDSTAGRRAVLGFERTAGDEIQGLLASPADVVDVTMALTRLGDWRIGIGFGLVEQPLPDSTRQARGPAYLAAREAVQAARRAPGGLRLIAAESVTGETYGEQQRWAQQAETALMLTCALVGRRSPEGWEVIDLLGEGLNNAETAARLGISASAVSQRLRAAHYAQVQGGIELSTQLCTPLAERPARKARGEDPR